MNNRKRVRVFTKKDLENFSDVFDITDWRSTLKKIYVLFLERNEYSLHNINQRYVLTFVF